MSSKSGPKLLDGNGGISLLDWVHFDPFRVCVNQYEKRGPQKVRHNQYAPGPRHVLAIPSGAVALLRVTSVTTGTGGIP